MGTKWAHRYPVDAGWPKIAASARSAASRRKLCSVGVVANGGAHVGVAELALHVHHRESAGQPRGGGGVAQIMEPDAPAESRPLERGRMPFAAHKRAVKMRAASAREDERRRVIIGALLGLRGVGVAQHAEEPGADFNAARALALGESSGMAVVVARFRRRVTTLAAGLRPAADTTDHAP